MRADRHASIYSFSYGVHTFAVVNIRRSDKSAIADNNVDRTDPDPTPTVGDTAPLAERVAEAARVTFALASAAILIVETARLEALEIDRSYVKNMMMSGRIEECKRMVVLEVRAEKFLPVALRLFSNYLVLKVAIEGGRSTQDESAIDI